MSASDLLEIQKLRNFIENNFHKENPLRLSPSILSLSKAVKKDIFQKITPAYCILKILWDLPSLQKY